MGVGKQRKEQEKVLQVHQPEKESLTKHTLSPQYRQVGYVEEAEVLKNFFLPQSSLVAALHTPLKQVGWKVDQYPSYCRQRSDL